ncbi:hypothetical protein Fcan01_22026 [Folsomia candida]|uniref:Uncharacterized protein n=1 Tax=Folsomia candida TaxID=158441 RepID=A0A226DGK9_FOLCA|nr:hypothetical protein Fcan01_22026 [Folsomia candida]
MVNKTSEIILNQLKYASLGRVLDRKLFLKRVRGCSAVKVRFGSNFVDVLTPLKMIVLCIKGTAQDCNLITQVDIEALKYVQVKKHNLMKYKSMIENAIYSNGGDADEICESLVTEGDKFLPKLKEFATNTNLPARVAFDKFCKKDFSSCERLEFPKEVEDYFMTKALPTTGAVSKGIELAFGGADFGLKTSKCFNEVLSFAKNLFLPTYNVGNFLNDMTLSRNSIQKSQGARLVIHATPGSGAELSPRSHTFDSSLSGKLFANPTRLGVSTGWVLLSWLGEPGQTVWQCQKGEPSQSPFSVRRSDSSPELYGFLAKDFSPALFLMGEAKDFSPTLFLMGEATDFSPALFLMGEATDFSPTLFLMGKKDGSSSHTSYEEKEGSSPHTFPYGKKYGFSPPYIAL